MVNPKKLRGSALVFFPQRRPNVEALVSAQDSIRMDTTAMSKGKDTRTKTTPMMYQITPFVDFFSLSRIKNPKHLS